MAGLADSYTLANDATFQSKIRTAMVKAAVNVMNSANPTIAQMSLATQLITNPGTYVPVVAQMVQSDTTVAASAPTGSSLTDAQIQSAVNTYLSILAR